MDQVGRYEILNKLGQGGQSIAFKARDPQIDRLVAIKLVRDTEHLTEDGRQEFSTRFFREAQAAGRLSHPNIATIYDIGDDGGRPFIAMEYVEGETLNRLVSRNHPLEPATVVALFQQLCAALQYAHDRGVVHRDIKPENIMVTPTGQVKIVDFGIARLPASTLTQDGHLLGTPSYMSPEQVQGHRVDHRSDIFSLGVVLYEALTGERPFEGEHPTTVIFKIVSDEQRPVRELNPELDSRFDAILARALAKKVNERYDSCTRISADLAELADAKTAPGLADATATLVGPPPAASDPTLLDEAAPTVIGPPPPTSWAGRFREQAGLLVLGVLLGAVGLVLALWWMAGPSIPAEAPAGTTAGLSSGFVGPLPPAGWATDPDDVQGTETAAAAPPSGQRSSPDSAVNDLESTPAEVQQRALAAFRQGNFGAAAADFARLVQLEPASAQAHYFLGLSRARTGAAASSVASLERAVELRPDDPLFRIQLGLQQEEAGQSAEAVMHLQRAVELGGHPEFEVAALSNRLARLQDETELAELVPYESDAVHDHFIRGCTGTLTVTRSELRFVTPEEEHSLELPLLDLRRVTSGSDRLEVILPDGKKYNFEIGDPARISRIFELAQRLSEGAGQSQ